MDPAAGTIGTPVVRIVVTSRTEGQLCESVFDFHSPAGPPMTTGTLDLLRQSFDSLVLPKYLACLSPLTTMVSRSLAEIVIGRVPTLVFLDSPGVVGTAGASNLALEIAANIRKETALKGRHGRGRIAMPAVPNTFVTPATAASVLNATGITAYDLLGTTLLAGISASGSGYGVYVMTRPTPPITLYSQGEAVIAFQTVHELGTARTRKLGRGI